MLHLSGELDPFRVDAVRDELLAELLRNPSGIIELDCAELNYLSAEGVRMLLNLADELMKPVVLSSMTDDCRRRIRTMGLEDRFEFR